VILRATELGHQDPLGYADAVSSEDCLHRIVTPVDIVDREAGSPSEQDGNIGMVGESARSAGPPHECDWRVGLALTLRGNHESGPGPKGALDASGGLRWAAVEALSEDRIWLCRPIKAAGILFVANPSRNPGNARMSWEHPWKGVAPGCLALGSRFSRWPKCPSLAVDSAICVQRGPVASVKTYDPDLALPAVTARGAAPRAGTGTGLCPAVRRC
jgi:hypothetical protein